MYKKIYWGFFILSFLFAQVIMPKNNDYGSIILIGMVIPTVLSYVNIEIVSHLIFLQKSILKLTVGDSFMVKKHLKNERFLLIRSIFSTANCRTYS